MPFEPVNDFERSLVKASTDPAHRPQFYRDFVAADLFVVENGPPVAATENRVLEAGTKLQLRVFQRDGENVLPIFSSLPRLRAFITEQVKYLAMNCATFLAITKGTRLILNPGSAYGKEFTVDEVASILDGSLWRPTGQHTTTKPTEVLIGQPARYPHELVANLTRLFQQTAQVRRAFLLHFFDKSRGQRAHTLIAIEASAEWDRVVADTGVVARGSTILDPPLELMQIDPGKTFGEIKPFYVRSIS